MRVEMEVLGSGTSSGIPTIGCDCWVCNSSNPRNKRLRSSVLFRLGGGDDERRLLVDVTPDIRIQALRAGLSSVHGVLITHTHADHCHGLDDLRGLYWGGGRVPIPLWAYPEALAQLRRTFAYIFDADYDYKGIVKLEPQVFEHQPFEAAGVTVQPIPVVHGNMRVAGFRIGECAYITDTNEVPDTSIQLLKGVRLLILDALRRAPHPTHLSLPKALETAEKIGVERVFFTHINHDLEHESINKELPDWAGLGYDRLKVAIEDDGRISVTEPEANGPPPIAF
ncbi:MAG: MBL fold metallo-hydrolase [Planctomycetes bacterium]|nr:MBL fold metallo-hydrolase [Planctomycetota bacterium]MCB9935208.1 MBL fold metallo-hydrolase [Planctomycetota bacterium]